MKYVYNMAAGRTFNSRGRGSRAQGQHGIALIEVLVAIALIGMLVGALTAGVITTVRSSSSANSLARANVLMTAFGETLTQLAYRDCSAGDLQAIYTEAFDLYEGSLPPARRLIPPAAVGTSVSIVAVDTLGGCVGGAPDRGEQSIGIRVVVGKHTRSGTILKRNPDYVPNGPVARPAANRISADGDPQGIFTLDGGNSTPLADIKSYRWECGDPDNTVITTTTPDAPEGVCTYQAPASGSASFTITLTVTDRDGVTNTGTVSVSVPAVTSARLPPVAVIKASCAPNPSNPCTAGNADLVVAFDSAGSNSLEGTIVSYKWNFGDPLSGVSNVSTDPAPSHTFTRDQIFHVQLTVTDDIGLTGSTTFNIDVNRPGPTPPTASFTMSPSPAVAPQTVSFDGRASKDASNQAVVSYLWDFGDNTTSPGATTSHLYATPGTYLVRLTVTDAGGVTAYTTKSMVVGAFSRPSDFRMTDARGELAHSGDFYFAWTNLGASAGDPVSYEIEVKINDALGGCVAFGSKTKTVDANPVGTVQTFDFKVNWPASNVCLWSTYQWRFRTKRVSPTEGTLWTAWSGYQSWYINHT